MAIDRDVHPFSAQNPRIAADLLQKLADGQLDGAWLNLEPGISPEIAARFERTPLGRVFSGRGPALASATFTATDSGVSLGIEHGRGPDAVQQLADVGVAVPDGWSTVQDHAKRGLVFDSPAELGADDAQASLEFVMAAVDALSPVDYSDEWFVAVIRRR